MIHLIGFKYVPNTTETADAFLREIYRLHGFPKVVTTDRGVQFTSQVWKELLEFFGTEVNYATTNYHDTVMPMQKLIYGALLEPTKMKAGWTTCS